jgi:cytochrome P450
MKPLTLVLQYRRACSYLQHFADVLVANGLKNPGAASLVNQMYAELHDPIKVRDNLLELVLGGQNMTSSILEWALAELELRPAMYERLRSEILATFGPEKSVCDEKSYDQLPEVDMTWNNLKKCQTLQNILHETLRCYPTLANIGKTAAKDTILPRGGGADGSQPVAVSKGATFTCNIFLMHRRKEFWGEDAW